MNAVFEDGIEKSIRIVKDEDEAFMLNGRPHKAVAPNWKHYI